MQKGIIKEREIIVSKIHHSVAYFQEISLGEHFTKMILESRAQHDVVPSVT